MFWEILEKSGGFKLAAILFFMGLLAVPGRAFLASLDPEKFERVTGNEVAWPFVFLFILGFASERMPYESRWQRILGRTLHGLLFATPVTIGMTIGLLAGW